MMCAHIFDLGLQCGSLPVTEVFLNEEYTKNRTYRRPFTSNVRASLAGILWALLSARKKIEFAIGGDAFSRCLLLRGLACTLQSLLFLVDILSLSRSQPSPIPPSLFLRRFGHVMRPTFSKIGGTSLQARTRDSASGSWLGQ